MSQRCPGVLRRLLGSRRGASALEFAIVIVPLILFIMSMMEFARLQWCKAAVQEVAMATARCIGINAVACSDDPVSSTANRTYDAALTKAFLDHEAAGWNIGFAAGSVTLTASANCQGISGFAKVNLSYTFTSGMLAIAGLGSYPITTEACFPAQS